MKPIIKVGEELENKNNLNDESKKRIHFKGDFLYEGCGLVEKTRVQIITDAIVEQVEETQVESQSTNSNAVQNDSDIRIKSHVEFQAGQDNYPRSYPCSHSLESANKPLKTVTKPTTPEKGNKETYWDTINGFYT